MQARSEETRQHILEAASRLFSQAGYNATGVAEICQAAGVSKGAFYHHFPSKQAVFLALLEGWLHQIDTGFAAVHRSSASISESILQMAELAGSILQSEQDQLALFLEFWLQAKRDPAIWQASIAPYRRYQTYFAEIIQEGITRGEFQAVNPIQAGRALVSLALGVLMQALFDPHGADWQAEITNTVHLYLNGISRSNE